jgi:hypothetical protein
MGPIERRSRGVVFPSNQDGRLFLKKKTVTVWGEVRLERERIELFADGFEGM